MAAAPGDQQADHRGRPLRRRRRPPSPQGWTRMKLYFLTGLPTETDDDTLGIAELARNCVAIGRRHTGRASVTVSLGGFVPKPHTPFQWFGQNTERRAAAQGRPACARAPHKARRRHAQVARPGGDRRRGHRQPRRPAHRARDRAGVARRAARSRSGASASTSTAGRRRWRPRGCRSTGTSTATAPSDEVLPWEHLTAGLHKDFLWDDWQAALAGSGVEDCRWTPCYDCGVCTGYGIEHVVASPVPPAGGSQGTGQDLTRGGEVPVTLHAVRRRIAAWREPRHEAADPLHQARQGPLHQPPRHGARIWERALRQVGLPRRTAAGSPPVPGSASAWRCRPAPSRSPSTSTSSSPTSARPDAIAALPARARRRCCPTASTCSSPPSARRPAGRCRKSSRRARGSSGRRCSTSDTDRDAVAACWTPADAPARPGTQGRSGSVDDVRPPILDLRVPSDDQASPGRRTRHRSGAACDRPSSPPLAFPDVDPLDVRALRTHQWISHDGDRREVLSLPAAVPAHTLGVGA